MRTLCLFAAAAAVSFGQLAAPNAAGVSIGHIHLMVADPEEHKKLWVGMLGAQVTNAGSLEMLKFPGVFVIVQKARTPGEGSDGSAINHFGFLVPSYPEIKKKLAAANLPVTQDNEKTHQITVAFPDNVRVEFSEDTSLKVPIQFHHIHLAGTDNSAERDWYVKTFGAEPGMRNNFPAAKFGIGEVDVIKAAQAPAPSKGRALDHIGFEVKNLQDFCKKLEADGVKFEMGYREVPQLAGLKIAFLVDPYGTRIELTEGLAAH